MGEIDLDPASSAAANTVVGARRFFSIEDDGLAHDWKGRVWMNPPYASELIRKFTSKLALEYDAGSVTQAIVLVKGGPRSWRARRGRI